jgi:hypothetical protein
MRFWQTNKSKTTLALKLSSLGSQVKDHINHSNRITHLRLSPHSRQSRPTPAKKFVRSQQKTWSKVWVHRFFPRCSNLKAWSVSQSTNLSKHSTVTHNRNSTTTADFYLRLLSIKTIGKEKCCQFLSRMMTGKAVWRIGLSGTSRLIDFLNRCCPRFRLRTSRERTYFGFVTESFKYRMGLSF